MNSFERIALEYNVDHQPKHAPGVVKLLEESIADNEAKAQRIVELSTQIAELTRQRDQYRAQCFELSKRQKRIDNADELALLKNQVSLKN